jgi:uncharacterized protein
MNADDIQQRLKARRRELEKLGVASLRLFGSYARGVAHSGSDIDIVVAFDRGPNFDAFMDLKFLLEEALGARVDLVTDTALRPQIKHSMEQDAVRVA